MIMFKTHEVKACEAALRVIPEQQEAMAFLERLRELSRSFLKITGLA